MAAGGWKWDVAAVITVVGWFVSPIITLLLAKILAFLGFDAEKKLWELKIRIIPELQQTLDAVDQKRMVHRGEVSHVLTLDEMAARLRRAQYEVDDIWDDEQEIKLYRRSRCWHRIHRALATCIARFKSSCVWIARVVQRRSARPLQWARKISSHWLEHVLQVTASAIASCIARFNMSCIWIGRIVLSRSARLLQWAWKIFLQRQKYVLPVTTNGAASHESTSTTTGIVASVGKALVATDGAASSLPTICDVASHGPVPMANDGATSHESARVVASVGMAPVATEGATSSPTTIGDVALDGPVPLADDDAASHQSDCDVASVGMALVATDGAASSPPTIDDVASDGPVPLADDDAASHGSACVVASLGIAPVATDGAASSSPTIGDVASNEPVPLANHGAASHEPPCVVASLAMALVATHDAASSPTTIGDLTSDGPVLMHTDGAASRESAPTTTGDVASVGMAVVATDVAALSPTTIGDVSLDGSVPLATDAAASMTAPTNWLSCWWSSLDFFKNCCRSIFYWLVHVIEIASFYRDWSYDIIHITSKQENATAYDFVLTAISRWKLKKKIENVENTVNELKNSPLLGLSSNNAPNDNANKNRSRITTPSTRKVFGRTVLRDDIMAKLRETPQISGTDSCYSVIGIYGVPGSGKTTFARYTRDYIEQECKEDKLFDTIMCIHLSKTFTVDDVFHEMLKDITNIQDSEISDYGGLKEKLKQALCGKRFFLILDDVWVDNTNDPQLWELKSVLDVGMKGSKILVTARTKLAAGALCADELIEMPDLDEDEYFKMFMHYAMNGRSDPNEEEFSRVGRVIAEKLHQSPIAAVAVAGRLGAKLDIKFWKNTANLGILNNTVDALWWSYQLLNPDIRRCLELCNIFSRRAKLQRVKLVHMWIAQGFIKTSLETGDMEDVAEGYIQELVSCSFLQPEGTCSVSASECFRIHDLLHDIIEKVAGSHCLRIENESSLREEGWKGYNPQDVHHLLVENCDVELITEMILGMGNLRTLLIYDDRKDILVEEKFIENICTRLPKLRVLNVAYRGGRTGEPDNDKFFFPESICMLKHLRHLAFRTEGPCIIILPEALTKLHHLQLLNLGDGENVEFTSLDLLNLQHIIWKCMNFPNVGKLTSLQTLSYFIVRNEKGYEVNQLRDLNKLRGKLNISGLENVKSKEEALEANLTAKEGIATLVLEWDGDDTRCSPEVQAEVLEGLCPPIGLETLEIGGYNGSRYPDWMVRKENGGPNNLQRLKLSGWRQRGPGPVLEAFTHLRVLLLVDFNWDTLPGNLEHLKCLKELYIRCCCCVNVKWLPTLPQSIGEFHLRSCNYELIKSCQTVGHPNWQKIEHIPRKTFNG